MRTVVVRPSASVGQLGPWTRRGRRHAIAGMAVGLLALLAGTLGAGGEDSFEQQLAWLNLAIVGSALTAMAQAGWLLQGRRALRRARRDIVGGLSAPLPTVSPSHPAQADLVTVAGAVRIHRPSCVLVRGKVRSVVAAGAAGPRCEVCRP